MKQGKTPTDKLQTNISGMLLAVFGFIAVAMYLVLAIPAQDALWFLTGFEALPSRVVVYRAGEKIELEPGLRGYTELAEGIRASLAQGVARPSGIGLSQGSLEDAYTLYVSVEAFFDAPFKLHAAFNTGRPTQALFLITGRHSDLDAVFLGRNGQYFAGAPVLRTTQPLLDALRGLGLPTE